jgi:hypothetical protein
MQAALDLARAMLADDKPAIRRAAGDAACPACVAVAVASFGFTLVSVFAGEQAFMSEQTRARLLAAIDAAQAELDGMAN